MLDAAVVPTAAQPLRNRKSLIVIINVDEWLITTYS